MWQSYFLFFILFTLIYCVVRLVNHLELLVWIRWDFLPVGEGLICNLEAHADFS